MKKHKPHYLSIVSTMIKENEKLETIADRECEPKYLLIYGARIKVLRELKKRLVEARAK